MSEIVGGNFLGVFEQAHYRLEKYFIPSQETNIRLPPEPLYSVCIIHGFGEHSGRFHEIADLFAKKRCEVLLIDLTGFGYSGGARGCAVIPKLENDVITLLKKARTDLPLYIYAHSLGGLVTLKLLLDRPEIPVNGCVITSPLLGFPRDRKLNWAKKWLVRMIGDDLEDIIINSMVNPTALTKNNIFIQTIFQDRLMIPFLSVKMAKSILIAVEQVNQHSAQFSFPVLFFHGKRDTITNFEDTQRFAASMPTTLSKVHLFQQGFHELQHDEERDELISRATAFLESLYNSSKRPFGNPIIRRISTSKKQNSVKWIFAFMALIVAAFLIIKKLRRGK